MDETIMPSEGRVQRDNIHEAKMKRKSSSNEMHFEENSWIWRETYSRYLRCDLVFISRISSRGAS